MKIPLGSNGLREKDVAAIKETLETGNLTMGEKVKEFERAVSKYLGVKHFIFMNSGSSANLAIFEALMRPSKGEPSLRRGDSVLVPAIAWPTTIWPIVQLGLRPIFVDVVEETLAIDLKKAQSIILEGNFPIKAIFPIHPLGKGIDHKLLNEFSLRNNLLQLNDVCESLGSWIDGVHAGTKGIASSFSFYFSHHITTMEGGGVATDSDVIADDLKSIRSHGWSRDRSDAHEWHKGVSQTNSKFLFVTTGYNIRPMEIQASIGVQQLSDINEFLLKRRQIAHSISSKLVGTSLSILGQEYTSEILIDQSNSWMLIPISVNTKNYSGDKQRILEELEQLGVETRPVLTGNFLAQPALDRIDVEHPPAADFPVATKIENKCFLVSAHHELSDSQIEFLGDSLQKVAKKYEYVGDEIY
jgi:CDP-4-dehydro-6-deoxyglucose reductase, E1